MLDLPEPVEAVRNTVGSSEDEEWWGGLMLARGGGGSTAVQTPTCICVSGKVGGCWGDG